MANWLADIFEHSVPNQIREHRERYDAYRADPDLDPSKILPFGSWLVTQGIDPEKLGLGAPVRK